MDSTTLIANNSTTPATLRKAPVTCQYMYLGSASSTGGGRLVRWMASLSNNSTNDPISLYEEAGL